MKMDKVYSLLGLAVRSRNVVTGNFSTEKAVKKGKAEMVIVSEDASDNTVKMFRNMCDFLRSAYVPVREERGTGACDGKRDAHFVGGYE